MLFCEKFCYHISSHLLGIYVNYFLVLAVIFFVHAFFVHAFLVHAIVFHLHLLLPIVIVVFFVLLFVHIFRLLFILKELFIVVLFIYGLHILWLRHLTLAWHHSVRHLTHSLKALTLHLHHHARSLAIYLHHITLNFLFQSMRPEALMPRRAKRSNLFPATKFGRSDLTIVITSKVTIRGLARQHPLASLPLSKVTDCALVAFPIIG